MMTKLKSYPIYYIYKDSDVPWLGQAPVSWQGWWFRADIVALEKETDGLLDSIPNPCKES